jgi:hypothetical protein
MRTEKMVNFIMIFLGTAHIKGAIGQTDNGQIIKGRKKHFNKNKREKLRRVFANC